MNIMNRYMFEGFWGGLRGMGVGEFMLRAGDTHVTKGVTVESVERRGRAYQPIQDRSSGRGRGAQS